VQLGLGVAALLIAAVLYVLGVLAVVEIILVTHLVVPAKTQAAVQHLHDWASTHCRQLVVTIVTVTGFTMLAHGAGIM
jgi:Sap, sulfolipid-1-addressing protein